jgi:hypothetical protein
VRNITLDVRYMLFVVDKYAGAKHLVDEMTLVGGSERQTKPEKGSKKQKSKRLQKAT